MIDQSVINLNDEELKPIMEKFSDDVRIISPRDAVSNLATAILSKMISKGVQYAIDERVKLEGLGK